VALYREKKIYLQKAASIAGVSLIKMKEFLMEKGINPRLGWRELKGACRGL